MNLKTIFLTTCAVAMTVTVKAQTMLPYQNPALSSQQRAEDLCSRLTIEEKAQIMIDVSKEVKRMDIPHFDWWNEALHGVGRNGFATVFPITMCMASSWDDALLYRVFDAVSDELCAKNTQARHDNTLERYRGVSIWTPNINIFRDPRWGRGQETYGEDPYLTTQMGLAVVRGLQGPEGSKYYKTLACAKHFAVHSGPEWNRHSFNIEQIPQRDLWETYLPAFKSLVQQGNVREVMCAYQRYEGDPCCGSNKLLRQILRDEWGFDGIVVSDCGAINDFWVKDRHGVSNDAKDASAKAVLAGTDVECGSNYRVLPQAVKDGLITEAQIDESVIKLLKARFEVGDFDSDDLVEWRKIGMDVVASEAHKALALQMAREGIILLQNRNNVLPLNKNARIAVIGPNATNIPMLWGNYSGYPTLRQSLLEGLQKAAANVKYIGGADYCHNVSIESRFSEIYTPDGAKGMVGTYYNNIDLQGEPVTTVTYNDAINLNNGGFTVFAPGVQLEDFSARYEGVFRPTRSETLNVNIAADDRMRIIFDGDTICDVWKSRQRIQNWNGEIKVQAGKDYPIVVEYMQGNSYAQLTFDLGLKKELNPQEVAQQTADCDVVVFIGGIAPTLEGEEMKVSEPGFKSGDRTSIELPQSQRDIIATLAAAGKKIVFVNCSGSAMGLTPESKACDAILQAWYGGEQAPQALAEILFGDVNPSGKLPITFYKDDSQLPDFLDYTMANRTYRYFAGEPLWAFGHGLSYTSFSIGRPKYDKKREELSFDITNTGNVDGTEIPQVYIRRVADTDGPIKTLRAYQRVEVKKGQTQKVCIPLTREQFEGWDPATNTMRVVPGKYDVMVGNASDDKQMQTISVTIK